MKKIILLGVMTLFILSGCGKFNADKAIKEFKDDVKSSKAYEIKGTMEIVNDEDVFKYDVDVAFKKDDYYRVTLVNQTNNHEQVILKNKEGVYVVTPSLNKSFKFQSDWPKNSSQAYLLHSLIDDIERKEEAKLTETEDGYVLVTSVNYQNNPDLVNQKLYFDDDMELKKVEVFNNSGMVRIKVEFTSINYKASFKDDYFDLSSVVNEDCCDNSQNSSNENSSSDNSSSTNENSTSQNSSTPTNESSPNSDNSQSNSNSNSSTTNKLEDIVYPLYIPTDTYLTSKNTIDIPGGQRVILTFKGEKNFILVEETISIPSELEIIPVYGDPLMLNDTIAALSNNSLHWHSNNIAFYLTGTDLTAKELMTIAESLSNTAIVNNNK